MASNQINLKIDARLENLSVIADFISATMKQLGVEQGIFEVQMAVDEACTNIIKYAYSGKEGIINIYCELQDNYFSVTIMDTGRSFDPNTVLPPDIQTGLDKRQVGGLGIYLMRKLMDEVSYSFDTEKGNTLVMKKALNKK